MYLAAGVFLSLAPFPPPPPRYTLYEYIPLKVAEKVRGALVHNRDRKYQHD
jgi:hypothetical protein